MKGREEKGKNEAMKRREGEGKGQMKERRTMMR